jgi:60S ribosomal protein uL30
MVESTTAPKKKKSDLPLLPEVILKKRHDLDDLARKKAASLSEQKPTHRTNGKKTMYVKKPETIVAQARSRHNHHKRLKRVTKKGMQKRASNKPTYAPVVSTDDITHTTGSTNSTLVQTNSVNANIVVVIRIRDNVGMPKATLRLLSQLGLKYPYQARFHKYTPELRVHLHQVEPYVIYGPPTVSMVQDLLERRGHVTNERLPLSDNLVIEKHLGPNILCLADLTHEIAHVGPNFDTAVDFLSVFQLQDRKTQFERRTLKLKDYKEYGDIGDTINDFLKQVL